MDASADLKNLSNYLQKLANSSIAPFSAAIANVKDYLKRIKLGVNGRQLTDSEIESFNLLTKSVKAYINKWGLEGKLIVKPANQLIDLEIIEQELNDFKSISHVISKYLLSNYNLRDSLHSEYQISKKMMLGRRFTYEKSPIKKEMKDFLFNKYFKQILYGKSLNNLVDQYYKKLVKRLVGEGIFSRQGKQLVKSSEVKDVIKSVLEEITSCENTCA